MLDILTACGPAQPAVAAERVAKALAHHFSAIHFQHDLLTMVERALSGVGCLIPIYPNHELVVDVCGECEVGTLCIHRQPTTGSEWLSDDSEILKVMLQPSLKSIQKCLHMASPTCGGPERAHDSKKKVITVSNRTRGKKIQNIWSCFFAMKLLEFTFPESSRRIFQQKPHGQILLAQNLKMEYVQHQHVVMLTMGKSYGKSSLNGKILWEIYL